jgi:hypothetical protein
MIINDLKAIYIHIPKNGGTTIGNIFHPNDIIQHLPTDSLGQTYSDYLSDPKKHAAEHFTYNEYKDFIYNSNSNIKYWYVFTFVRNPYSRVYSTWKFLCYQKSINNPVFNNINNDILLSFEIFVNHLYNNNHKDFCIDQTDYIQSNDCNFIGRYENFISDLSKLLYKFNIHKDIPYLNKTSSDPNEYKKFVNKHIQNTIYSIYKEDFLEFDYSYFIE